MSHLSDLSIAAQIRFVLDAWHREKKVRASALRDRDLIAKIEESLMCIECMENIQKAWRLMQESHESDPQA